LSSYDKTKKAVIAFFLSYVSRSMSRTKRLHTSKFFTAERKKSAQKKRMHSIITYDMYLLIKDMFVFFAYDNKTYIPNLHRIFTPYRVNEKYIMETRRQKNSSSCNTSHYTSTKEETIIKGIPTHKRKQSGEAF